eukprot:g8973.t1
MSGHDFHASPPWNARSPLRICHTRWRSSRSRAKQANERSHSPSRFALAGAVRHGWRDPRVVQRPRPRIVRQIQTYDAFENMGNPFDVYATFFGLSVVMLVILFVFPFATNFGRGPL